MSFFTRIEPEATELSGAWRSVTVLGRSKLRMVSTLEQRGGGIAAVVAAAVQFRRPFSQVVRRIEVFVIPAQFFLPFFRGQTRPGGLFFADGAGQIFVIFFGVLDFR